MNKTLAMVIRETQEKITNICNESNLTPIILDLIFQNLAQEIRILADNQLAKEKSEYEEQMEEKNESE